MKNSKVLRIICYVMLPILVACLIIATCYSLLSNTYYTDEKTYFSGVDFRYDYLSDITTEMDELIYADKGYNTVQDGEMTIYYTNAKYQNSIDNYLIMYKNKAITNVKLNTISEIKDYILENKPYYLKYENQIYSSNADVFSNANVMKDYFFNTSFTYYTKVETPELVETPEVNLVISDNNLEVAEEVESITSFEDMTEYCEAKIENFTFYTSYDEKIDDESDIKYIITVIEFLKPYHTFLIYMIPVVSILIIIICIYLVNSIGHQKGKEKIVLTDFDKVPLEIIGVILCIAIAITGLSLEEISYNMFQEFSIESIISIFLTMYIVNFSLIEAFVITFVARIKAKQFLNTCICGRLVKWFVSQSKKVIKKLFEQYKNIKRKINDNIQLTWKLFGLAIIVAIGGFALIIIFGPIGAAIDLGLYGFLIYEVLIRISSFQKLEKALKNIYEGEKVSLEANDFSTEFGKSVEYVNDISKGVENAVNESLKSERLKTELITNVSHDIKTPLTSIINYVDLIKKENIDNDKVKEYIGILDDKSQRLKKLTEDLVEASKASSGNVNLNLEEIGIVELLKQAIGEYKDKFEAKKLIVISEWPNENIKIKADSKYLYRVIDNLFGNISKYTLEGSRVYIDVKEKNGKVKVILKNISKDKLNITEDELMQRFVRGDKSRSTEGSGLGLAIAKSLTELQKGKLECKIDGDLFKVELEFDMI